MWTSAPTKASTTANINVLTPQGRPKPQLTWTKDGKELEDHVAIRNSLDSSVLFIRQAERWDSGCYDLQLRVGDDVVISKIEVAVIGTDKPKLCLKLYFNTFTCKSALCQTFCPRGKCALEKVSSQLHLSTR